MSRPLLLVTHPSCTKLKLCYHLFLIVTVCLSAKFVKNINCATITIPGIPTSSENPFQPCTTEKIYEGPKHDPVTGDYAIYPEEGFPFEPEESEPFAGCAEDEKRKKPLPYEKMEIADMIRQEGYDVEEIKVTTEDGYILTIQRIPASPLSPQVVGKPPVLLWHGLLGNARSWLFLGNESLAFKLADAGFDVFLGNSRGNHYSFEHEDLNDDSDAYWDFSFHEVGFYDLPNTIDKILQITGARDLYYIGHSLGSVVYNVAVSMRPRTASKIKTGFLLSPASHNYHTGHPGFLSLIRATPDQYKALGLKVDSKKVLALVGEESCTSGTYQCGTTCEYLVYLALGGTSQTDPSIRKFFAKRYIDRTSTKLLQHLSQIYKSEDFRRFDWESKEENKKRYGDDKPPLYDLWNITTPTVFFWGYGNNVISPEDVKITASLFSKDVLKENNRVMSENFGNLDFLIGNNVQELVYDRLIWLMKTNKYERIVLNGEDTSRSLKV